MVGPFSPPPDDPPARPADADAVPTYRVDARGTAGADGGTVPTTGKVFAVIFLLVLAFASGVAVDQAAWRGTASVPVPSSGPAPTSSVGPPATFRPSPSGASGATSAPAEPTAVPTPAVTPGPTIGPGATVPPFAPANIGLLWDSLQLIQENFVRRDTLNPTDETYGAINGLVDSLGDPGHTAFLTPAQVQSENDALSGSVTGIGVFLGYVGGVPTIVSVISGSPAAKAGLLSGDRLITVDGQSAAGLTIQEIATLVRGPAGTSVDLTVIHAHDSSPLDYTITRAQITVPAISWTMVPETTIADIRISQFSTGTTDQFVTALRGARQAGATAIILDLRNNPGGFVDDAVGVSSQLLASGNVYIRQKADKSQIPVPVRPGGIATDIPLVVLVDFGTASSAEITAGAVQDAKRAQVIGTRTYGTGTVLNTFPLSDGSAIRIGVEEWLTPAGRAIFPDGIQPDQVVDLQGDTRPLEPDTIRTMSLNDIKASGDDQFLRALQVLGS